VDRRILIAIAVVCDLAGTIWILQGVGVIRGSFMTGQIVWSVIGAILLAVSALLYAIAVRRPA
jgi:hypothetical protein